MFYQIKDVSINRSAVDFIEWRKERFVLSLGPASIAFPLECAGQANEMAKGFIRAHDGTLVNPEKVLYVEHYPQSRIVYTERGHFTIVDAPEMEKLEALIRKGRKK